MAIKVTASEALEKATAVNLVKLGRATPEEQKMAYLALTEPKPHRAKNISKAERTAFAVHTMLRYMESVGEPMSHNEAYVELAENWGLKKDTVRRDYERFMKLAPDEQNKRIEKVRRDFESSLRQ